MMCIPVFSLRPLIVIFCTILSVDPSIQTSATKLETMRASDVKWAHAVNSRKELEEELAGPVDFLEADISMGHIISNPLGPVIPIMAHPPINISDISLENWLDIVIARATGKGIKLDIKFTQAVEPSLRILERHKEEVNFPVWLNADILKGPVEPQKSPVDASTFLKLCQGSFPNSTLSVGWTTWWLPTIPRILWHYEWYQIRAMVDTLKCVSIETGHEPRLTFPVRAIYACRSIPQLQWLLRMFPESSLTIWSSRFDSVVLEDLLKIRGSFHEARVYYDVPDPLKTEFEAVKDVSESSYVESAIEDNGWWTINYDKTSSPCLSTTYTDRNTIFFGKGGTSAVLLKESFKIADDKRLQVKGLVQFIKTVDDNNVPNPSINHELVLALADVSLFKKNTSSELVDDDDTDVIRNTLNSSRLFTFQLNGPSSIPCYYFKFDTQKAEAFQVWKLSSCDSHDDLSEKDILEKGTPLIGRNTKLVLPSGPVMFGFLSSGNGQVVVHGLNFDGNDISEPRILSGVNSPSSATPVTFSLTVLLITLLLGFGTHRLLSR